jgi:hypothetical protein
VGFDPHARIVDMDADGIDAAFLYPSLGLFAGAVEINGHRAFLLHSLDRNGVKTRLDSCHAAGACINPGSRGRLAK